MSIVTILESIKQLNVVELSQLVKSIEQEFGVSAAAAVVSAGPAVAQEAKAEEKNEYKVILKEAGSNTIGLIKVLRAAIPSLGLKEAKDIVVGAPAEIAAAMPKAQALELKKAIAEAGGVVDLV